MNPSPTPDGAHASTDRPEADASLSGRDPGSSSADALIAPHAYSPFDAALASHALNVAARKYARRHGEPGTPEYRDAWARFRQQIRTPGELRRWEAANSEKQRASRRRRA